MGTSGWHTGNWIQKSILLVFSSYQAERAEISAGIHVKYSTDGVFAYHSAPMFSRHRWAPLVTSYQEFEACGFGRRKAKVKIRAGYWNGSSGRQRTNREAPSISGGFPSWVMTSSRGATL